jgi:uncharacterized protein YcbX
VYVKELWRYPVKSTAGEPISEAVIGGLGIEGDRLVVIHRGGRLITSRTHPKLLSLKGTLDSQKMPRLNGFAWNSDEARKLIQEAAGATAEPAYFEGPERFDVLPLLVATDGAIAHLGIDSRRLRPNIIIGGVEGLTERSWPGLKLQVGKVVIQAAQLRGRCVMTTWDPDTQVQDPNVLKRIVRELDGTMALDCEVISGGKVRVGDEVTLVS